MSTHANIKLDPQLQASALTHTPPHPATTSQARFLPFTCAALITSPTLSPSLPSSLPPSLSPSLLDALYIQKVHSGTSLHSWLQLSGRLGPSPVCFTIRWPTRAAAPPASAALPSPLASAAGRREGSSARWSQRKPRTPSSQEREGHGWPKPTS